MPTADATLLPPIPDAPESGGALPPVSLLALAADLPPWNFRQVSASADESETVDAFVKAR
jgi:hypothetical protein